MEAGEWFMSANLGHRVLEAGAMDRYKGIKNKPKYVCNIEVNIYIITWPIFLEGT